jgi:hypothetical protein
MTPLRNYFLLLVSAACAFCMGCGGSSSPKTNAIAQSGQNVAPITVNSGPTGNYANGGFTSVTLCVPGTSTCQTIDGVLVDTGSFGLRILSSALTVALPQQNAPSGNPVVECFPFVASYTWGPVKTADFEIAGERANSLPVQILSDTDFKVPSGCLSFGVPSADTLGALGAHGILGVWLFAQDCGGACEQTGGANPGLYYECPSSGCVVTGEALAQQVTNPVALFSTDNNGVIIELPAVTGGEASVSGSLVFGIGTESNNGLGSAAVYTPGANGFLTVSYNGTSYNQSFIDSGSNGIFFLDNASSGLPNCATATGFYCPSSTKGFSVTNKGNNGTSGSVAFSVANAESLFSNPADFVFADLAGPNPNSFDWGLPFFFGRNVFVAIEGKSTPSIPGPYWAY